MDKDDLLEGEQIERVVYPHPLSFMNYQSQCIILIIWGGIVWWLTKSSDYKGYFQDNPYVALILWGLMLLLIGVIASLILIQWRLFILHLIVFAVGAFTIVTEKWWSYSGEFIGLYSMACAIIGFLLIEGYRRAHRYILTNMRIIYTGGLFTAKERTLTYNRIVDVGSTQGFLGKLLGFGTIIPTIQHKDISEITKEKEIEDVELEDLKKTSKKNKKKKKDKDEKAEGEKEIQALLFAKNPYLLRGVYPFKEVRKTILYLYQGKPVPKQTLEEPVTITRTPKSKTEDKKLTTYQREQLEFQRRQIDLQQQMKELLQKQMQAKAKLREIKKGNEEEIDEEETREEDDEGEVEMKEATADEERELIDYIKNIKTKDKNDE